MPKTELNWNMISDQPAPIDRKVLFYFLSPSGEKYISHSYWASLSSVGRARVKCWADIEYPDDEGGDAVPE